MTATQYFEDVRAGAQTELGSYEFTSENIKAFARKFDPQPFHTDEVAAAASHFGALCASGWHTCAACMKVITDHHLEIIGSTPLPDGARWPRVGPSSGIKDLVWSRPVYVGDRITFHQRVLEKVEIRSRPTWGLVIARFEGINQNRQEVLSFINHIFTERRNRADD